MAVEVGRPAAAAGTGAMIIRRRCPGCGGPVRYTEGDGATSCGWCGLAVAILDPGGRIPALAMPPRLPRADAAIAARRELRRRGIRVRAIDDHPPLVYSPFYRLRADVWIVRRAVELPEEPVPEGRRHGTAFDLETARIRFEAGQRELTLDDTPTLDLGRLSLGVRTQTCEAVPIPDLEEGLLLPGALDAAEALDRLATQLRAWGGTSVDPAWQIELFAPAPELSRLFAPYFAFVYRDAADGSEGTLLVDAINGDGAAQLRDERLDAFRRLQERGTVLLGEAGGEGGGEGGCAADGLSAGAGHGEPDREANVGGTAGRYGAGESATPSAWLVPLVCPACSAPLPMHPRARLHGCTICGQTWRAGRAGMHAVRSRALWPAGPGGAADPAVAAMRTADLRRRDGRRGPTWLPFYRLLAPPGSLWVPAFGGRHPRPAWTCALALSRRRMEWTDAETMGEPVAAGAPVELDETTAVELAPFVTACLERAAPAAASAELCWLPFIPSGPDLVVPGTSIAVSRAAITPWAAVPSRAEARTGSRA